MTATFLTAEWRWLLMLNYACAPDVLLPHVPGGTELDTWNGTTYVSMVGFRFLRTRVRGVPVPFHRSFDEVNLRFYVRCKVGGEWRRGVVFIKELVPRRAIAAVARFVYGENYQALPMRHRVEAPSDGRDGAVQYEWNVNGRWNAMRATFGGVAEPLVPGSEPEFIAEHYWGYTKQRAGTLEYRVEHPPWRVWTANDASLTCDTTQLYGPSFADVLAQRPQSAFVADGSAVSVLAGVPLRGATAAA